ncbi:hypothetical protein BGZ83_003812 [Gryganskiella cystojenkinii]|nr:hypothetical protein BGZ83_003812 [Gryganskiella cystojenkinii]
MTNKKIHVPGKEPLVLIIGAGIAGLILGALLEKIKIPYMIFERMNEVKALGSVMCLNASVMPLMEQLGIYEQLLEFSLPSFGTKFYDGDMNRIADIHMSQEELLYELLLGLVPDHKIFLNKKVLTTLQNKDGVLVRFADNTSIHGDILVGADGTYSAVRQNLYKDLTAKNVLPSKDAKELARGYITMVGTTERLDPEKYPDLKLPQTQMAQMIGLGNSYTWTSFTVKDNRFCWSAQLQLTAAEFATMKFRVSSWSPETNKKMIDQVREFKTPYGTLGDFIDATPDERISKVYLEDKFFETWHHGRTVLVGDAAHKLLPSLGQGAVSAMQDAVILANCIYEMSANKYECVQDAFRSFKAQRYPIVKEQYNGSKIQAKLIFGQTWFERMLRYLVFNYMPESIKIQGYIKTAKSRPQASFLPQVPKRGISEVDPQIPSEKYKKAQEQLARLALDPKAI